MFGENIKQARKEKNISQDSLARMAGVTYSTLNKTEAGYNQNPGVKTVQ